MMPMRLARGLLVLSHHELFHHHEVLAGKIDKLAETVQMHSSIGEAAYLLVHGLAKVLLIWAIFHDKRWGFTGLIGVLSFFAIVELTRAIGAHELITGLLSLFDAIMVLLIWKEYRVRFLAP